MDTVKAKSVSICIFTWKNYASVNDATGDDRAAFNAFAPVVAELRAKHGASVPVYLDFCPLTNPDNQLVISQAGIDPGNLPAVQMWAEYDDGKTAQYILLRDTQDKLTGVNWTPKDVQGYVTNLLYKKKGGAPSLLCKTFPIVCKVPRWALLAAAGFSTFEAATSSGNKIRQVGYGAAAGLAWNEFFARGGFDGLFK